MHRCLELILRNEQIFHHWQSHMQKVLLTQHQVREQQLRLMLGENDLRQVEALAGYGFDLGHCKSFSKERFLCGANSNSVGYLFRFFARVRRAADADLVFPLLRATQPSIFLCLVLSTPNAPAGTFSVITEPAAV